MIFTAIQVDRSQSTSKEFEAYGANNLAPAVASETIIYSNPTDENGITRRNLAMSCLNIFVAAQAGNRLTYSEKSGDNTYQKVNALADKLFAIPEAVTTLSGNQEANKAKALENGFKKITQKRYAFFQGPSDPESIQKMARIGGELYAFSPSERVSLGGAMAALIIKRLLFYAFNVLRGNYQTARPDGSDFGATLPVDLTIKVRDLEGVKGHFFPYFDGLLLPDKDIIRTFIGLFIRNLGNTPALRKSSVTLLARGWKSLNNTTGGRIASHMIYLLDIAIKGGFRCRPVYNHGSYCGMLLMGNGEIFAHAKWHAPTDGPVCSQEIQKMTGHQEALEEILHIAAATPLRETKEVARIEYDLVDTARKLHYILADRKFSQESETLITKNLANLRFKQTFFKIGDEAQLLQTIDGFRHRLDPNAPCDYLGGNMFSKKKILSALLAYGPVAPSVVKKQGANVSLPVTEALTKKSSKAGRLNGIPVFTKPIQEAYEDWAGVRDEGMISFTSKGKAADGTMRVSGISNFIKTDKDLGQQVLKSMCKMVKRKGKRSAEDEVPEEFTGRSENAEARQKKKARVDAEAALALEGMGWAEAGDDVTMTDS